VDSLRIQSLIDEQYRCRAQQLIEMVKRLGPECSLSADSRPGSVWEEFKYQLQDQKSPFFWAYEDTIRSLAARVVESLPEEELRLLWLGSEGCSDYPERRFPVQRELADDVAEEIYRRLCNVACDEWTEREGLEDEGPEVG
jgi:hypothetical protein